MLFKKATNSISNILQSFAKMIYSSSDIFIQTKGVNLGGGKWRCLGWRNIDERHSEDKLCKIHLDKDIRLPFKNNSLFYVFSSHFFEHIDDKTTQNLLNEVYRILLPGGILRISIPNFELAIKKYLQGDNAFFDKDWGMAIRYENWISNSIEPSLESKLAYIFCGYSNLDDRGLWPPWKYIKDYYCGPPRVPPDEIKNKVRKLNISEFSDWLLRYLPDKYFSLGHINCYDEKKIIYILKKANFSECYRSEYRKSKSKELRIDKFDNRPDISLYFEAIK